MIIPNYPNYLEKSYIKRENDYLTVLYYGWLGENRGSEIIEGLLSFDKNIKIISAGWFSDKFTEAMFYKFKNNITYHGVLEQKDAQKLAIHADYILCCYAPINDNNINASPNKIYDSIHLKTPVIINSEVKISSFVKKYNIGIVIDNYDNIDYKTLTSVMKEKKNSFDFSNNLSKKFCWEKFESILIEAHCF